MGQVNGDARRAEKVSLGANLAIGEIGHRPGFPLTYPQVAGAALAARAWCGT